MKPIYFRLTIKEFLIIILILIIIITIVMLIFKTGSLESTGYYYRLQNV